MNRPYLVPGAPQTPRSFIGRYRLLAEIGRGGMADVYLAAAEGSQMAPGFHKLLVVKVLKQELADEPEFVQMFLEEARLAARLNHPNVVQTLEVGQDQDRHFLAMEYLEGQPLHRIVQRSGEALRLTLAMRLTILVRTLAALHYAHELTDYDGTPLYIVHRDVSPANLFVAYEGHIKLVDFGIAKAMDSTVGTRIGMFKGKAGYMPPEQARGEAVDRRADVYAAGVVLWELMTGRRMWRGLTQIETLKKVAAGEVPAPSSVEPRVPAEIERICMKALAPRKDDRYPTAAAFAAEIEEFARRRCPLASDSEIGKAVADGFVHERERIREIVDAQLTHQAQGAPLPEVDVMFEQDSPMQAGPPATLTPSSIRLQRSPLAPLPGDSQASVSAGAPPAAVQDGGSKRSGLFLGGGVAVLLVAAGVFLFFSGRGGGSAMTGAPVAVERAHETAPDAAGTPPAAVAVRGVTDKEIKLGMSAAFSGPSRELGLNMKLGLETAFQMINDAGGVHGRKLALVALDDGYEATRTADTMKELIEQRGVFAFIGNVGLPTSLVAAPYASQNKTLFFGAFTGSPSLRQDPPDRYVFNYRASYLEETAKSVKYLLDIKKLAPEQIVVFAQEDAYGDAGYEGTVKALRKHGRGDSDLLLRAGYKRNTVDIDAGLAAILRYDDRTDVVRTGPNGEGKPVARHPVKAVIMVATSRAAAKLIQKARERNRLGDAVFVSVSFGGIEALAEELKSINPALCPSVLVTQVVPPFDSGATGVLRYREQLAKYQPQAQPGFVSLEGFIVGSIFAEALRRAGPALTTEKLIDTLEAMQDLDQGFGRIGFSISEHQGTHKLWATRLDKTCAYRVVDLE